MIHFDIRKDYHAFGVLLLLFHTILCALMTGIIMYVQWVHYPIMAFVGRDQFVEFQKRHVRWTTHVVGPLIIAECATGAALCLWPPDPANEVLLLANLFALILILLATAVLSVPAHGKLESGFDPLIHRRLVSTNWIRTVLWIARLVCLIWLLATFF